MTEPTRYPLAWPAGRPRKSPQARRSGNFKANGSPISLTRATERLEAEITRLGAVWPLLSTDYPVRMNGTIVANGPRAQDPGAVVYFQLKGKPYAMACDTYDSTAQNIAALAAHIESTRAIERYGVASAAETLQTFQALPPPEGAKPARPWRDVLGLTLDKPDRDEFDFYFKCAMRRAHPDNGGSDEAAAEVNAARDAALIEMGWKT